jgi:hypothetical protein
MSVGSQYLWARRPAASLLTAVVETAASLLTALGPSKIYIPKNHQMLKWPDAENIARR